MRRIVRITLAASLLLPAAASAGPANFDIDLSVPPIIRDSQAAVTCTIAFLIEDTASGDIYAQRIRLPPAETDQPVDNRMPCTADALPRLSNYAREVCNIRATDKKPASTPT
ncbi:MAG: hypothetical protein ACJ8AW_38935 [Rhodopila sp.]